MAGAEGFELSTLGFGDVMKHGLSLLKSLDTKCESTIKRLLRF